MKKNDLIFSAALLPIDYVMIVVAAVAAYFLRYDNWVQDIRPVVFYLPFQGYLSFVWWIALFWLVIFALAGLYQIKGTKRIFTETTKVFLACSTGMLAVIVGAFFSRELFDSRFILLATWVFSIIFVSLARGIARLIQRFFYKKGKGVNRVVIVGSDEQTEQIASELYKNKRLGYRIVLRLKDLSNNSFKKLETILKNGLDEVIQGDLDGGREENVRLLDFCQENHLVFKYTADFFTTKSPNMEMSTLAGVPIVEVKRTRLDGWGKILKRVLDIILSFLLLVVLSPVLLLVAIFVKLDSKGSVFYSQVRVGAKGQQIKIYKFRSMVIGAEKMLKDLATKNQRQDGPLFKIEKDPRVTRVGVFIRKWSLDELPQFWNVLKGDMSLVGPRPHLPSEVQKYEKRHKQLLDIKPGVTGMAQVSGRSGLSFEEEVRLDIFYIENWSMWLDLIIFLKTPWAVIKGRGAS